MRIGAKVCESCRSRQELSNKYVPFLNLLFEQIANSNEYLFAKFGVARGYLGLFSFSLFFEKDWTTSLACLLASIGQRTTSQFVSFLSYGASIFRSAIYPLNYLASLRLLATSGRDCGCGSFAPAAFMHFGVICRLPS